MPVPYTFGTATASIPLSQLDSNFATAITIGNTAVQLGNTVTTLNNMTLANVTISSGNVTITNVSVTTANVSGTANVQTLAVTQNATVAGNVTVTGNVSMNVGTITTANATTANVGSLIVTGNQTFTGTGNRITGDFSNATSSNRVLFQTSTTNGQTATGLLPNGTSTQSQFAVYNGSDPLNASQGRLLSNASEFRIENLAVGTGTYLPMTFYTGGSERARIDTSGNVGIGTSSPSSYGSPLSVYAATNPTLTVVSNNANAYLRLYSTSDNNMYLTNTGGSMTMNTANTERMRVDTSGNVLVGTTGNPASAKFFVAGTSAFGTAAAPEGQLTFDGTNAYLDARLTGGGLIFRTNGSSERMRIDSSGNAQFQAGAVMPYAPAPASISTTATLTNANIQAQIINTTGTTYTVTMPLGTTLETLATWATTNIGYDFFVINTATGIITMAVNTGVTSLGLLTIAAATSAHFRIRRTAANTFVLYRLV